MRKRVSLTIFAVAFALSSWAAGTVIDGIHYILDSNTMTASVTYTCSSYLYTATENSYSGSITIPSTVTVVNGLEYTYYTVISIGGYAFEGCEDLTSVTIPNTVKSIEQSAFSGCEGLTSITIPNSVTSIGSSVFTGCSGLISITIPNSVTSIGENAFAGCSSLTNVTIPNSITNIGVSAFVDCKSLTSISIPESVTSIGETAFNGAGLKSITIPSSVNSIGMWAFRDCTNLESVTLENTILGEGMFRGCTNLRNVDLGTSLMRIGDGAFLECHNLKSIDIPNSLTYIGSVAFQECLSLSDINFNNAPVSIENLAFGGCNSLKSIILPTSILSIAADVFHSCYNLSDVYVLRDNPAEYNCDVNAFSSTSISIGTLHVPARKKKTYAAIEPWSQFGKILEEGWYDETNVIKNIEQLSNSKAYIIHTQKEARGSLGVANGHLASTNENAVGFTCDKPGLFSIIKYNDAYYLFSIDDSRYITNTGEETEYPGKEGEHALSLYKQGEDFVFDFSATGNTLNVNRDPGIVVNDYGTANGQFDEGNLFTIEEVGDFEPDKAIAMFNAVDPVIAHYNQKPVQAVSELDNHVVYTATTKRAAWYIPKGGTELHTTLYPQKVDTDPFDACQQFAFLQSNGNIYIYAVGEKKILNGITINNPNNGILVTDGFQPVSIQTTGDADYPLFFSFGENYNINVGGSSQITIDNWNELDEGNRVALRSVKGIELSEDEIIAILGELNTGIGNVLGNAVVRIVYYNLQGQRINEPQRGVNIIRYSDGTTKKVFIK